MKKYLGLQFLPLNADLGLLLYRIAFVVEPSGAVSHIEVMKATGPDFGEEAARAVAKWKYRPGQVNGRAVRTALEVPLVFSLKSRANSKSLESIDRAFTGPVSKWADAEVKPAPVTQVKPVYPPGLREKGITADVVMSMVVDRHGFPCRVKAVDPAEAAFGESAVRAVRQWRFTPGQRAGKPINVEVRFVMKFTISSEEKTAEPR
jgi:TonB family protein